MKTSEVLYGAAEHVAEFGHIKHTGHGPGLVKQASACVIGAINVTLFKNGAKAGSALTSAPGQAALQAMHEYLGAISLPSWNDAPERTAEEVVAAFKAAALIEAAREDTTTLTTTPATDREQAEAVAHV